MNKTMWRPELEFSKWPEVLLFPCTICYLTFRFLQPCVMATSLTSAVLCSQQKSPKSWFSTESGWSIAFSDKHVGRRGFWDRDNSLGWTLQKGVEKPREGKDKQYHCSHLRLSFMNDWTNSETESLGGDQKGNSVELKQTCNHMLPMQAKDG